MRVYGSSPLYNYVELIFRAKRLFIASFIIALVISVSVVVFKSGSYNANAIILLAGSTPNVVGNDDPQRGSIQFKLNILNLCLKDPEFMKRAFKSAGLDRGRTEQEFTLFSKEATAALVPASGQNLLELSCRWKTPECADIISAFYNEYSQRVLDEETVATSEQTKIVRMMLTDYTQKQREQEQMVVAKMKQGANKNIYGDYPSLLQEKQQAENKVKALQNSLQTMQRVKAIVLQRLAQTPQTIEGSQVFSGATENTQYRIMEAKLAQVNLDLADARQKNTDANPKVKALIEQRDRIDKDLKLMKAVLGHSTQSPTQTRIEKNPNWLALDAKRSSMDFDIQTAQGMLTDAEREKQQAQAAAIISPVDQFNFKWATINKDLYANIRSNLSAKLEQAIMDEKRDRAMHTAELQMAVKPTPVPEVTGGTKSLIFIAVGPLIGLIVAFAFSLLTETLDHSLRTPLEVERFLGKPVLAVLPRLDTGREKTAARRLEAAKEGGGFISS